MRTFVLAGLVGLVFGSFARADQGPSIEKIGKKIDRVNLVDVSGKPFALHDLKDKKAIVVVFLSFECPVSTSYAQPLADMAHAYGDRGVAFIGVCPNDEENPKDIAQHVQELKIPFPVYPDGKHAAAAAFQAQLTPEAFVLDANQVLRYRGRIDNGYAARLKKNYQVTQHDLRRALDEVLAGKPVTEPATQAVGCAIALDRPATPAASGAVTYYRDVLPILQNNCQTCHRAGEVGPFSLMTYRQAVRWAGDIKEYTQARKMPPWKPVAGPAFQNERRLSDREIATLAAWADGGTPEGNLKNAPPPRRFVDGWQQGKPDLVLTVDNDFQVGPSGNDIFRCFVLPTNLTEDKDVVGVEVRPGNPRVVHHALLFIDSTGQARKLEQAEKEKEKKPAALDVGPGYSSAMGVGFRPGGGLGGWAPGQQLRSLPEGTGYHLPRGTDVVMQLHYHRDGRLEKDRTSIGLYFAKKPVARRFQSLTIRGRFILIPAGNDHFQVTGTTVAPRDGMIHSVMPHMHMLGREIKVTMTPPDGKPATLVAIKDWDYNWQETYFFKQPIAVKAGTRFDIEAIYDNSARNPNNPNTPPRPVVFGEQTTNEMCFGFLGATSDGPLRARILQRSAADGQAKE